MTDDGIKVWAPMEVVEPLLARAEKAEAAIMRVREVHQPHRCRMSTRHIDCFIMYGGECNYVDKCNVCRTEYPCSTIRALDGDNDE